MRLKVLNLVLIGLSLSTSFAMAADGAPGQPPSGTGGTIVNPKFEPSRGEIDVRTVPVDLQGGIWQSKPGGKGIDLKASARYDIFIFGADETTRPANGHRDMIGVFKLGLGADGEVQIANDASPDKIKAYRFGSPSFGIFAVKSHSVYGGTGSSSSSSDSPPAALPPPLNIVHADGTTEAAPTPAPTPKPIPPKVDMAGSFELVSVMYENQTNKIIGLKVSSALIEYLKFHGQVSFKINDVNFDLCGGVRGTLHVGQNQIGNNTETAMPGVRIEACAGVQIGKLANLRDEFSWQYMGLKQSHNDPGVDDKGHPIQVFRQDATMDVSQVSNTVRADKIGGSPASLYWESRYDYSGSGGQNGVQKAVTTNTFGAAIRF